MKFPAICLGGRSESCYTLIKGNVWMLFSLDLIVKDPLSKFQPESLEQLNSVSWVERQSGRGH